MGFQTLLQKKCQSTYRAGWSENPSGLSLSKRREFGDFSVRFGPACGPSSISDWRPESTNKSFQFSQHVARIWDATCRLAVSLDRRKRKLWGRGNSLLQGFSGPGEVRKLLQDIPRPVDGSLTLLVDLDSLVRPNYLPGLTGEIASVDRFVLVDASVSDTEHAALRKLDRIGEELPEPCSF